MTPAGSRLSVSVAELLRRPGTQRAIELTAVLDDLALSSSRVPAGAPVEVRVVLEATSDASVTVRGTVTAPFAGECRRCLQPVEGTVEADVHEVFESADRDTGDDTYPLDGDHIDLDPVVRDAVLLVLPLAPLCDIACGGPDPDAHPVRPEGATAGDEPDPRWDALRELRFDEGAGSASDDPQSRERTRP